ncbi:MAG: SIS domain-containing protein [Verrucomicrobia bacterium]|nr:SIS domain-containing protein [Verrucomicrobiota bacterium]
MRALDEYLQFIHMQLSQIENTQRGNIEVAANWVSSALQQDKFIYVFGSGHSHTLAEEVFYRAGGLARCIAILDGKLMVHESASESTEWERKEGYAAEVLQRYAITSGDILIVVSNSGRNAVPIEMAMEATRRGAKVIAISSSQHSGSVSSRHSSGKKLSDVAQLTIDNSAVAGDATIDIPGLAQRIGPTSTITSAFILNAILVGAVEHCVQAGKPPEVYGSINSDAGAVNDAILKKYKGVIPHL